jgi:hypothetical protein
MAEATATTTAVLHAVQTEAAKVADEDDIDALLAGAVQKLQLTFEQRSLTECGITRGGDDDDAKDPEEQTEDGVCVQWFKECMPKVLHLYDMTATLGRTLVIPENFEGCYPGHCNKGKRARMAGIRPTSTVHLCGDAMPWESLEARWAYIKEVENAAGFEPFLFTPAGCEDLAVSPFQAIKEIYPNRVMPSDVTESERLSLTQLGVADQAAARVDQRKTRRGRTGASPPSDDDNDIDSLPTERAPRTIRRARRDPPQ